ncbi:MAG: hypothetical protein KAI64_03550 [Thermoplasmata archaeon]|nr:hypothetical protein [Thermoplasmata archaeon]
MEEYENLIKEIDNLKSEVERLREVVSALFQMVVDTNELDYELQQKIQKDLSFNN